MILDEIVAKKVETFMFSKYRLNNESFIENFMSDNKNTFKEALDCPGLSIIGEIKKASPSKGIIKEDFNPLKIATDYEGSVEAISVLTEEYFFKGSPKYLKSVSREVGIPTLRKDFIINPIQIIESKDLGASAILLISAILNERELKDYILLARGLKMDALVEVHSKYEMDMAILAGADIIGINNRNLNDFSVDLTTTLKLREMVPKGITVVSESGIHTKDDIEILKEAKIDAVLVGESFMLCKDIKKKAEEFKNAYSSRN